ncbi:cystathionine beta-lyase [Campylobacter sp. MIT 12-5580]|uniref:MalY/PatB family protein n=1 Tax=Campylobacter sp. MIT 12-5580 TaxID=2040651 RepID=UPI0010F934BB|nr:MalY/PatB family protein [Campylobacter sp. MIT 12-5580]TKX29271.1 cystathionine beta-lyase [Campylobacter sp. MIT 12-5580]
MNFDAIINRKNTDSLKYSNDNLPMWVADMDFKVAPCIQEAMQKRLDHGIFGYTCLDENFFKHIITWWDKKHKAKLKRESLVFSNGIVPTLGALLRILSEKGDKILLQSPVYHAFFNVIKQNERVVLENKMLYKNGIYNIDFKDLEQKLIKDKPKIMILCNPHNPIGKIFSQDELRLISKLCKAHNTILISDEIHCDIVEKGFAYTSMATIDENAIIMLSSTKAFNLAALAGSYSVINDKSVRLKLQKELIKSGLSMPNPFFIVANNAALSKGQAWLEQMNAYIKQNKSLATEFIEAKTPCKVVRGEALYLIWVDCSAFCKDTSELYEFLKSNFKLQVSNGKDFGGNGKLFLRINIACPEATLKKGLKLFEAGVKAFIKR